MGSVESKWPYITRLLPNNDPVPEDVLFEIGNLAADILDHLLCW